MAIGRGIWTRWDKADGPRLAQAILAALAFAVAVTLSLQGVLTPFENGLRQWRATATPHPPSGKLVIVEIDAASLRIIDRWPWPRSIHADLIARLREQEAATIAFDVDFSARSSGAEDARMAAALRAAGGGVILPTFQQHSGGARSGTVENLPIPEFRDHAVLAAVNIRPDRDGVIRTLDYGVVTVGVPRPTMAAMLAGAAGRIGSDFPITARIDPSAITRFSAVDVLERRIPRGALAGRTVLIGATAIELGDRYAVPGYGVLPGVIIQALAAETLANDLVLPDLGALPALALAALLMAIAITRRSAGSLVMATTVILLVIAALPLGLEWAKLATLDVAPALVAIVVASGSIGVLRLVIQFETARATDFETGLANGRALRRAIAASHAGHVVTLKIGNSEELSTLLGPDEFADFVRQLCSRLRIVAQDSPVYSLGGGRFAWHDEPTTIQALTESLDGLASILAGGLTLGSRTMALSSAFGIAPLDATDRSEAVAQSTLAADEALAAGTRWQVFGLEMRDRASESQTLLTDFETALERGDLYPVFQPKWSIAKNRIDSAELLLRWNHPTLGMIPPDRFIAVLEQRGRLADLTLHFVNVSLSLLREWALEGRKLGIAVNVSAPLFQDAAFRQTLLATVRGWRNTDNPLTLEITESAIVADDRDMIETLTALRQSGVRISIDDYGTGQSTLSYLKRFPADEIKIDRSFVTALASQPKDQILVRSTIAMAQELGFSVVAEGVEDMATFDLLVGFGCDSIQGWLLGKAMSALEFEALCKAPPPLGEARRAA